MVKQTDILYARKDTRISMGIFLFALVISSYMTGLFFRIKPEHYANALVGLGMIYFATLWLLMIFIRKFKVYKKLANKNSTR
ncbi:hypothetical protein [Bacillus pseudomycoides]|uniref:hypothetical protein n=1 Tax=Bacillus pseudomycoides TaxID=64104 RepID=UPI000BEF76C4|nr:hypothetical protein [Bacillus pseudomycoides]PEM69339.1 hypothetical protein CN619_21635 [Bacillus pseudomycoides]PGA62189.1 hypothetical protein COL84_13520 [Bacillus pseudomycoides]